MRYNQKQALFRVPSKTHTALRRKLNMEGISAQRFLMECTDRYLEKHDGVDVHIPEKDVLRQVTVVLPENKYQRLKDLLAMEGSGIQQFYSREVNAYLSGMSTSEYNQKRDTGESPVL